MRTLFDDDVRSVVGLAAFRFLGGIVNKRMDISKEMRELFSEKKMLK